MKNRHLQEKLSNEVTRFIHSRKSLQIASLREDRLPYASYAPYAIGDDCLYVLLSEIAVHAINLQHSPTASVLIIEDEDSAAELFARVRVNYTVTAELIEVDSSDWRQAIELMAQRLGDRIHALSELNDFKLFRLRPAGGRYVKGFGRAYRLAGNTLAGDVVDHMRDGHRKRSVA